VNEPIELQTMFVSVKFLLRYWITWSWGRSRLLFDDDGDDIETFPCS